MEYKFSPLFWPAKLKGNTIYVLDETLLPDRVKYIKITDKRYAYFVIKSMKTRAFGQIVLVLYLFLVEIRKNRNKTQKQLFNILNNLAKDINSLRPTISFKYLTDMLLDLFLKGKNLKEDILNLLELIKDKRIKQAKEASKLIDDNDIILTHCNISGLLPLIGEFARKENKRIKFFVTETRPYLQGSRLTSWELAKFGFDVVVISDNTVAFVMERGIINKVIVGADQLAKNGDIANKIGTFQIAILAKHFNIPFYVICPPRSDAKTGRDIKIEIRPKEELLKYKNIWLAPKKVDGYYPAFDITPNNLITKHIYLEL